MLQTVELSSAAVGWVSTYGEEEEWTVEVWKGRVIRSGEEVSVTIEK